MWAYDTKKESSYLQPSKENAPIHNSSSQYGCFVQMESMVDNSAIEVNLQQEQTIQSNSPAHSSGNELPPALRERMEARTGIPLDDVRVHYNSDKPIPFMARAFTKGNQIYIAYGQEDTLEHELCHVVQQKQGRVRATGSRNGEAINDDKRLEEEAENQSITKNYTTKSQNTPVIQLEIQKAGAELELKGVQVYNQTDETIRIAKHTILIDNPRIEVDAGSVEYVSPPAEDVETFFGNLENGRKMLQNIQDAVCKNDANLTGTDFNFRRIPGSEYIAKPQCTVEISKDGLTDFVRRVNEGDGKMLYRKVREAKNNATEYIDSILPKVNEEVLGKVRTRLQTIGIVPSADNGPAFALTYMVAFMLSSAEKQDALYYKARFGILPRTSLREMYQQLSVEQKEKFNDYIGRFKTEYGDIEILDWSKLHPIPIREIIRTILNDVEGSEKTLDGGRKKFVDGLSSDFMASKDEVGASVGALDLPPNSDGIFELRAMPYIKIDSEDEVKFVYEDIIRAFL